MHIPRPLLRRARNAFNLAAIWFALSLPWLNSMGHVGDGFEAVAAALGSGPAVLCFAIVMLFAIYGGMLVVLLAVMVACGLASLVRRRLAAQPDEAR